MTLLRVLPVVSLFFHPLVLAAQEDTTAETIIVEGRQVNLVGTAISASEGVVGNEEISVRPMLRTGEVLELVPGMVVTQHSGTGKANQYFLRGFNLDHGTDFATYVDGMPVNMRTHGHGQGYTDLNFIIPETVQSLKYQKGTYNAAAGDFSGAGSAYLSSASRVDEGTAEVSLGEDAYQRLLLIDSVGDKAGWLYALEYNRYDGPWTDISEDLKKLNLLLRHTRPLAGGELSVGFMGYDNRWNSADQIPARAVRQGLIDALGSLDTTVGGESSRYSLNAAWHNEAFAASVYAIRYDMNLWSNFTYFLDDEVNGDQFEQVDERTLFGGDFSYSLTGSGKMNNTIGLQWRYDDIDEVGLYSTAARQRLGVTRSDAVEELSAGVYWDNQIQWNEQLRTVFGLRYDWYDFSVDPLVAVNRNGVDLSDNGGSADDDLVSARASVIYQFAPEWETYLSAGQGFHSNDARGTTIQVDPGDGSAVDPVDPLVATTGYEWGLRGFLHERLNTSLALWALEIDSELLFVGDAGNTEASRASQRHGIELTAYYRITHAWTLDFEYAWTDAQFADSAPEGDYIPGSIEHVLQTGISGQFGNGWLAAARLRYFGERPLVEDNSIRSDPSTVLNLRVGYEWQQWGFSLDVLNALDSDDHDIDYYYESRLAGEAAGVEDVHYHVLEPRTVRGAVSYRF